MEESRLEITQAGREALGQLVLHARTQSGQTNWDDFAYYLAEQTQVDVKKDTIWKLAQGNYSSSPSFPAIYALLQIPEFTFLDSSSRLSTPDVMAVLTEQVDVYGKSLQANHRNPSNSTS
jgi:hypothetical protein